MHLDSRSRVRLGWLAAAAAPMVFVQAVRLVSGGHADAASAATAVSPSEAPAAAEGAKLLPPTEEQRRALEWLAGRQHQGAALRSPMDVPKPVERPMVPVQVEEIPLPKLRLGGIATRRNDSVASINNRLMAVGDEPAAGWRIVAIDADARAVRLERHDGKLFALTSEGLAELDAK